MRVERGGVRAALAPGICARAGEQQVPKKITILESVVLAGSFFASSEGSTEAVVEMAAPPRTTGNTMWKGGARRTAVEARNSSKRTSARFLVLLCDVDCPDASISAIAGTVPGFRERSVPGKALLGGRRPNRDASRMSSTSVE